MESVSHSSIPTLFSPGPLPTLTRELDKLEESKKTDSLQAKTEELNQYVEGNLQRVYDLADLMERIKTLAERDLRVYNAASNVTSAATGGKIFAERDKRAFEAQLWEANQLYLDAMRIFAQVKALNERIATLIATVASADKAKLGTAIRPHITLLQSYGTVVSDLVVAHDDTVRLGISVFNGRNSKAREALIALRNVVYAELNPGITFAKDELVLRPKPEVPLAAASSLSSSAPPPREIFSPLSEGSSSLPVAPPLREGTSAPLADPSSVKEPVAGSTTAPPARLEVGEKKS